MIEKQVIPQPDPFTSSALRAPSPVGEGKRNFCLFERGHIYRQISFLAKL